jgi:hypothetical protein
MMNFPFKINEIAACLKTFSLQLNAIFFSEKISCSIVFYRGGLLILNFVALS